jgi:glycolate oxidase
LQSELIAELKYVVGENYVLSSDVDLAVYECDAETLDIARPDLVVLPASTEQVQACVQIANKYNVPFTPRGAGTGLSGGATTVAGGISLVLTRMSGIIEIDKENMVAHVQVGLPNLALSKACEKFGLYFAPDPSSQAASTIGGNLAENSGGPHTLKYGMTCHHVAGVKVVLPDGKITTFGGKAKDNLGLDLLGVFVGSEGTLGVVCEAYVKLSAKPNLVQTMFCYFPDLEQGGQAVSDIVSSGVIPSAMEMVDKLSLNAVEDAFHIGLSREAGAILIVELDGAESSIALQKEIVVACVSRHQGFGITWAKDEKERATIWKARKSAFGALGRIAPHGYVLDGVIPRSKLREAIKRIEAIGKEYNLLISNIYHAGDGNLHPCLLFHRDDLEETKRVIQAGREILDLCLELGGTLSGEHGIGIEKIAEMPDAFSPKDLEAMEWLHHCFNPKSLCNPGKILPSLKLCGESGVRPLLRHQLSC